MRTKVLSLAVLALLVLSPALAAEEEARTIGLPIEGLSLDVPAGWTIQQYGSANLELKNGKAVVWFYLQEAAREDAAANLRQMAERVAGDAPDSEKPKLDTWEVAGASEASRLTYVEAEQVRFFGVIEREGLPGFDVEAIWPPDCPEDVQKELGGMLDTVDVTPYEHPDRLVDWTLGFTLDGADMWVAKSDEDGIQLQPASSPKSAVRVRAAPPSGHAMTRLDRVVEASLTRVRNAGMVATPGPYERFEFQRDHGDAIPAVRTRVALARDGRSAGALTIEAVLDGDVALILAGDGEGLEAARTLGRTFRARTDPGPRKGAAGSEGEDEFPSDRGPGLRFALPDGWTLEETTSAMRLATFHPGEGLTGIAYFFGAGSGGSLEANLERWKGQWPGATSEVETIEGKGVKLTVLDLEGKADSPHSGGANPHDPHASVGQRALFVYIEVEGGPVTLKLVGSGESIAAISDAFHAWLRSFHHTA